MADKEKLDVINKHETQINSDNLTKKSKTLVFGEIKSADSANLIAKTLKDGFDEIRNEGGKIAIVIEKIAVLQDRLATAQEKIESIQEQMTNLKWYKSLKFWPVITDFIIGLAGVLVASFKK